MVSILKVGKGARVQLRNGWFATMVDGKVRDGARLARVEGYHTDTGSVYSTDIVKVETSPDFWEVVQHTPNQLKAAEMRKSFGF